KTALRQLEQKLTEAQAKADLLITQHRRARAVGRAADAHLTHGNGGYAAAFDRMKRKVAHAEAHSHAKAQITAEDIEHRLSALEKEDRIEQALVELKTRRGAQRQAVTERAKKARLPGMFIGIVVLNVAVPAKRPR